MGDTGRDAPGVLLIAGQGCYLIHFARPYQHAGHYLGWASDIAARITRHKSGDGARLIAVIQDAGIEWEVVRTWIGADREFERELKRQHNTPRLCPACNPEGNSKPCQP